MIFFCLRVARFIRDLNEKWFEQFYLIFLMNFSSTIGVIKLVLATNWGREKVKMRHAKEHFHSTKSNLFWELHRTHVLSKKSRRKLKAMLIRDDEELNPFSREILFNLVMKLNLEIEGSIVLKENRAKDVVKCVKFKI